MSAAEFLTRAESALASSKRDFEAGDYDGAANQLYYAMFHAARAALDSIGIPPQGKHGTVIARFGRHFCRDGPLSSELGRAINEAQELRVEGDYGSGTPDAKRRGGLSCKSRGVRCRGQNDCFCAAWIACHTLRGVAGIARSRTPKGARASRIALITTAKAGVQPPSPPALMPNGLVGDKISTISTAKDGRLSERGIP